MSSIVCKKNGKDDMLATNEKGVGVGNGQEWGRRHTPPTPFPLSTQARGNSSCTIGE